MAISPEELAQLKANYQATLPKPKKRNLATSLLPAAGAIGAGLLAAPFTGGLSLAATIAALGAAGAVGGGIGELGAQGRNREKFSLGKVGKEAILSGAFGAGGGAFSGLRGLKAAHAAGASGLAAKQLAQQAARGSLAVKNIPAAFASQQTALAAPGLASKAFQLTVKSNSPAALAYQRTLKDVAGNITDPATKKLAEQMLQNRMVEQGIGKFTAGGAQAVTGAVSTNALGRTGTALRQGIVNPKVAASPFGATTEARITEMLGKEGLKGSARSQYQKLPSVMQNLSGQIEQTLAQNTTRGSLASLGTSVRASAKNLPQFVGSDAKYIQSLRAELKDLGVNLPSKFRASDLAAFKSNFASKMDNVFTKVSKGVDLNPKEAARYAVWKGLDQNISKLAPEAKALTLRQSNLYEAAPGLLSKANKTLGIPILGIKSQAAARGTQAAQDVAGRALQGAGGVASGVTSRLPQGFGAQARRQLIPRALTGQVGGEGGQQSSLAEEYAADPTNPKFLNVDPAQFGYPEDMTADNMMTNGMVGSGQLPSDQAELYPQQSANPYPLEQALMDAQRDPKNAEKYLSLHSTIAKATEPAESKLSADQRKTIRGSKVALNIIDELENRFTQAGGGRGGLLRIPGRVEAAKGALGLSSKTQAFRNIRKGYLSRVVRALGEVGTLNEGDIQRIIQLVPDVTSTPEEASIQFESIRGILQDAADSASDMPGGQGSSQEDLLSALMQMQGG